LYLIRFRGQREKQWKKSLREAQMHCAPSCGMEFWKQCRNTTVTAVTS